MTIFIYQLNKNYNYQLDTIPVIFQYNQVMNTENPRPSWSFLTKLVVISILFTAAGFFLSRFTTALPPIILAVIIAYLLTPWVNSLQYRLKISRGVALMIAYLVVSTVITTLFLVFVPLLIDQLRGFNVNLRDLLDQARQLFNQEFTLAGVLISGPNMMRQISLSLEGFFQPLLGTTLDLLTRMVEWLVWIIFIIIISVYLIKDSRKVIAWFDHLAPPLYREDFVRLRTEMHIIWSAFFRGQIILSVVVTVIITALAFIIGLPFPLILGVLAGLLEFLPSVGHAIWITLAGTLALLVGSTWLPLPNWAFLLLVIAIHILFTQTDLNYLIPRIIGRSVQLPPMVVILGIVAGASIAGVLGIFLAAPTIASLRILLRYIYARLIDEEPFGEETPASRPLPPPNPRWWKQRMRVRHAGKRGQNGLSENQIP